MAGDGAVFRLGGASADVESCSERGSSARSGAVWYRMPKLALIDRSTGLPVRRPTPVRYEMAAPGQLVHVDIKKLGRIPDCGGHRTLGRQAGKRNNDEHGRGGRGCAFLHHAVDDHSRVAYSEILGDERKETVAAFWERGRVLRRHRSHRDGGDVR